MRFTTSILAGAAIVSLAATAGAQDKKKDDEREKVRAGSPSRCIINGEKVECTSFRERLDSTLAKRAVLGVSVGATGSMRDTLGVFVTRVTPKGPAENAGIVEGDRIVSINGVDLRLNAADAEDSYASGLASRRLTREMQKLTPGNGVNLRVWSGGRVRDVQVTAGKASDFREGGIFGMLEGMPRTFTLGDRPWGNFEFRNLPRVRTWVAPRGLREFRFEEMPKLRFEDMPGTFHFDDLEFEDDDVKKEVDKKKSAEKSVKI
jgi:hypothetical protein